MVSHRVGVVAGVIAALSHHLAHFSNFILPDSLCPLPVLAAMYLLARAYRARQHPFWLYATAGLLIGASTWLRPQSMLEGVFIALMLVAFSKRRRVMVPRAAVLASASLLAIMPITIRNYVVYGEFIPVNIGMGIVLWEGIAEASGDRFGAVATDSGVAEQEAFLYNDPEYADSWSSPDGIKRDRDRVAKSLDIIIRHPLWYAGVMVGRMGEMVKYSAHAPLVFRAEEVRAFEKSDAIRKQWRSLAPGSAALAFDPGPPWLRSSVRLLQRLAKEAMQVSILCGLLAILLLGVRRGMFLLIVPSYYLLFQSLMHTEFRYTLPMHYFLFAFAAISWTLVGAGIWQGLTNLSKKMSAGRNA
jgi:hypothetical protein